MVIGFKILKRWVVIKFVNKFIITYYKFLNFNQKQYVNRAIWLYFLLYDSNILRQDIVQNHPLPLNPQ